MTSIMDARERLAARLPARLPASFQIARTPEARAAFESAPLEEWEALVPKLRSEAEKVRAKIPAYRKPLGPQGLTSRSLGPPVQLAKASFRQGPAPRPRSRQTTGDADKDRLPDTLEDGLWQAFVPRYFISAGETDQFAFFANNVQTVITGRQATPPIGYYSVLPLFLGAKGNVTYGFAQVNYATFWDHDSGLAVGRGCRRELAMVLGIVGVGIAEVLDGLKPHALDQEHSAALVAAPLTGAAYNPDPLAYRMYMFYTAAHEGEFVDQSEYYFARPPAPPGSHVQLYLTRSKHATYAFPPDEYPIAPDWLIFAYFWILELLFLDGRIAPRLFRVFLWIGEVAFFQCYVEQFEKRDDGVYPSPVINVGEPRHPLNGAVWAFNQDFAGKLSARWTSRILPFLGFRYAGPPPGDDEPDPGPDPDPDPEPPDRDPIPR